MKYTAFLSKVSVEKVSVRASSRSEAITELRKLIKKQATASSAVLRYALTNADGDRHFGYGFTFQHVTRLNAAPLPRATSKAMRAYFLDELVKCLSVVEALANGPTTEDLVIERDSDIDEVLASRDYEEEYEALMSFIVFARRAMNLPDVLAEESVV